MPSIRQYGTIRKDVETLVAGDALHFGGEILGPVIDRMRRADFHRPGAFRVAAAGYDDFQPEQFAEQDGHRADPAGTAVDQHRVAVGGESALEQIDPHGEQGFGHRRGFGQAKDFGDDQAGSSRRDAIFGIATARDQRADLAIQQPLGAFPRRDHRSRDFEAEDIGRPGRRRIDSAALKNVRAVDPGGRNLDQDFVAAGLRHRAIDELEHFGATGQTGNNGPHFFWNFGHWRQAY